MGTRVSRFYRCYGCGEIIQNPPLNCLDDLTVMFREFRHFRHRIIGQLQPPPSLRTCIFTAAWHVFVQGIPILCLAPFTSHPSLSIDFTWSTWTGSLASGVRLDTRKLKFRKCNSLRHRMKANIAQTFVRMRWST